MLISTIAIKHQTDPLTKLPNRAHLAWRFKQIVKEEQHLSAIITDINSLKMFNETHGHAVGDLILCEFAKVIKFQLREVDAIGLVDNPYRPAQLLSRLSSLFLLLIADYSFTSSPRQT
jgi:GGDEF domain-containing protein